MHFDVKTLALVINILDLMLALVLVLQFRANKKYTGPGWWAIGFIFTAVGFTALISRDTIDNRFIYIILANALLIIGNIFIYTGVIRFIGKRENWTWILLFIVILIVAMSWFTYFRESIRVRAAIMSGAFAVISLQNAFTLYRHKDATYKLSAIFSCLVLAFFGLVFLIRTVDVLAFSTLDNLFMQDWFQIYGFLTLLITHVLLTFGLVFMVSQRLQGEMIEDKKALIREQYLMDALMNNLPDHIYFKDIESRFIRINKAHAETFGLTSPGEETGKTDFDFFSKEHAHLAFEDEKDIIYSGKPLVKEEKETWTNRPDSWVSTIKVPLRDQEGDIVGTFGISRDITERKQAEKEIEMKNDQLQKMIAEKDKLFSIIAHDLRSPFNALLGLTDLLADETEMLRPDEIRNMAVMVKKSASSLNSQLENLLEWSRIQMNVITINPVVIPLKQLVDVEIDLLREAAGIKKVRLINLIHDTDEVTYDKQMLQSVVRNLLSNALKFTRSGGEITLTANSEAGKVKEIAICDNGIGMGADLLGRIFQLSGKSSRRGTNGEPSSGLGLIICHDLVAKHGGQILVWSEEGVGSTFTVAMA